MNYFNQKSDTFEIKPGYHHSFKIVPNVVKFSKDFENLDLSVRKCKLPSDTKGFKFLKRYTRTGCKFECAAKHALELCKCLPWFYPNNFTTFPMCDMYGAGCFEKTLSNATYYKKCDKNCVEDCSDISYSLFPTLTPLDTDSLCQTDTLYYNIFNNNQDRTKFMANYEKYVKNKGYHAITCPEFVKKFVARIAIGAASSSVTISERAKKYSLSDQIAALGGTLGLFSGISLRSFVEILFCIINIFASTYKKWI